MLCVKYRPQDQVGIYNHILFVGKSSEQNWESSVQTWALADMSDDSCMNNEYGVQNEKKVILQLHTLMLRLWNVEKTLFHFRTTKLLYSHQTYQLQPMTKITGFPILLGRVPDK